MPLTGPKGREIAYEVAGEGRDVVLVHGFASNRRVNWGSTGWIDDLVAAGFRTIAIDNLGHGESAKPRDRQAYDPQAMADDVARVMDVVAIPDAAIVGYSMGARIAAFLAAGSPDRVRALALGGIGENLLQSLGDSDRIVAGLLADDPATIDDPTAAAFRLFADRTGSDRAALAACMSATRRPLSPNDLARIACPTLIVAGDADSVAGDPVRLGALISGSEVLVLPGRDHMRAVGDKAHKRAAIAFLDRHA